MKALFHPRIRPGVGLAGLMTLLLLAASLAGGVHAQSTTVRLAVFGDDGTTSTTQANVNGALANGAQGYIGLGDYYYWSAPSQWISMFQPLTSKGAYLALGNHDDRAALSQFFTSGTQWSKSVGGARVVSIDSNARVDPGTSQYNAVRSALCNAPEQTRILVTHHNWWLVSGARHPGSEFPASAASMDQLVKDCGVDLVMAGHEHNYQRMMRNGVPYLIVGTGGQSLYPLAGMPSGTVASYSGYGRLMLDLSASGFSATFRTVDGTVKDTFSSGTTTAPTPAPAPAPSSPSSFTATFSPKPGNNWWVETLVSGSEGIASVTASVNGGAPVALPKTSWGSYAKSFNVPTGSVVTFTATSASGATATSGGYAWPSATPVSSAPAPAPAPTPAPAPAPSSFAATFKNVRGNAWWIESDVATSGGTLAGVDARVNGGAWVPLAKQSWGSWAKSMNAPTGSKVEFRARATDGSVAVSGIYTWPVG